MEDRFFEEMVNTSIKLMEKLTQGEKLTPDELKFILLTKQMSDKKSKGQYNPLNTIIKDLQPIVPVIGSLLSL